MALGLRAQRGKIYENTHFAFLEPKRQKSIKIHILYFSCPIGRNLSKPQTSSKLAKARFSRKKSVGIIRRGHSFSSPGSWTQMALGLRAQRANIYRNTHFALLEPKGQKSIKLYILYFSCPKGRNLSKPQKSSKIAKARFSRKKVLES